MPRITAYKQLEYSDCGITCIRIVAKYYGQEIPLKTLRTLCDTSRLGISLSDLINCAQKIGFDTYSVMVNAEDIYRMPLPAILHWEQNHYVVLYKTDIRRKQFYIADPARGKVSFKEAEFFTCWKGDNIKGISVLLTPSPIFYNRAYDHTHDSKVGLIKLFKYSFAKYKANFISVLVLTIIAIVADVTLPMIFRRTIDEGIEYKDIGLVWLLILCQLGIFIGGYVSNIITEFILTKLGLKISINLVNDYLNKLIKLPMSFFDRKVNSDLIQKIDDQNRIKNFLVSMPDTIFFTTVNVIVFSGLLIYYNYIIFAIVVVGTLLSYCWLLLFSRKREELDYSYFTYSSMNRNNIYELIHGMPEIKINNAHQNRVTKWNNLQEKINTLSIHSALIEMSINGGNTLISRIKELSITGICATLVIHDQMTLGTMMTISYIVGQLSRPVSDIIDSIKSIQDASISYERLDEVINQEHINDVHEYSNYNVDQQSLTINLREVSFKYPGSFSTNVIKNLSTVIPHNKVTAIVGASGSGKTTLIKLMLGFYKPQQGEICVGDQNIANINNDAWLKHCGVVMQSGYIFSGTVLENIALSDSSPDLGKARIAAKIANIDAFIDNLPMGYNTKIGTHGMELSGGQKQRLYIARAVYKNPDLLFLDEATSSLDANNESNIINNLVSYYTNRTVVISAHRLSTVKNADKIIYLEDGKIIEEGSHDELISLKGRYYTLVKNQLELGN